jgi:hypothetical protein
MVYCRLGGEFVIATSDGKWIEICRSRERRQAWFLKDNNVYVGKDSSNFNWALHPELGCALLEMSAAFHLLGDSAAAYMSNCRPDYRRWERLDKQDFLKREKLTYSEIQLLNSWMRDNCTNWTDNT